MPSWMVGRLGLRMQQLDGVQITSWEGALLGMDMGRPIITYGDLWHTCIKVHEMIKLLFRVVSGVSQKISLLDRA